MNGDTVSLALTGGGGLHEVALGILGILQQLQHPVTFSRVSGGFPCPVLQFPGPAVQWGLHPKLNN